MSAVVARRAGRVLLVDGAGRVLLLRGGDPQDPAAGTWWFTPGGGLDDGESFAEAAARELAEETGLAVEAATLGPVVHTRETEFAFNGGRYRQHEHFYLLRVARHDVSTTGFSALELASVVEHRWWPVAALRSTGDRVFPAELPDLLTSLGV